MGSANDGQLGLKSESTVGTGVTVDQFLEGYLSGRIQHQIDRIPSRGKRNGRKTEAAWKAGVETVSGTLELELWSEPLATLMTHMFGTVVTTGAGPYTHTCTPGSLLGKSLTIQTSAPAATTTTKHPFTSAGCKVSQWTINADVNQLVRLSLQIVGMTQTTGTALATASYGTGELFVFTGAQVDIAGSESTFVKNFSLTGNNNIPVRHRVNSATSKEPLEEGMHDYTGTITADFESLTAYNRFVNGTEAALVLTFTAGSDTLTITMNVRFDGDTPDVPEDGILEQVLPFTCTSGTSDAAAITAVLVNGESSAA